MGFHTCAFCGQETSSGDVTLAFSNGALYRVPDILLHYVAEHDYLPPLEFVDAVLYSATDFSASAWSPKTAAKVGYLTGEFPKFGERFRDDGFKGRFFLALWRVMRRAELAGARVQTRGG